MADDPLFRCPGCGSFLTARAALPGLWECHYCSCLFPTDIEEGREGSHQVGILPRI